jgi:hypothetical protein
MNNEIIINKMFNEGIKFRLKDNNVETLPLFSRASAAPSSPISRIKILSFSKSGKSANIEIDLFEDGDNKTIIERNVGMFWIEHFIINGILCRKGKAVNHYRNRNKKHKREIVYSDK